MIIAQLTVVHVEESCGWGGQEIRIVRECQALAAGGHRTALICQPQAMVGSKALAAGIPVWHVTMAGQVSIPSILRMRHALRELQPAIVHTHSSIDSWLAVWNKGLGYRLVRTRHIEVPVRNYLPYRFCDYLITTGEDTRDRFIQRGFPAARLRFLPTGIDSEAVNEAAPTDLRRELGVAAHTPLIATVAVLRSWKGHQDFIAAAEQLLADNHDAMFLLIGAGPQQPVLAERLRTSPFAARIRMLGHRNDVPGIMAAVDIVVHPSTGGEGVPQAILQAWAAARPVIATSIPNVRRMFTEGRNGLLVEPGQPEQLASAIKRLLREPPLRQQLGAGGKQEIAEQFTWRNTVEQLENIYRKLSA